MSGWSIHLKPDEGDRNLRTIHEFYDYVDTKVETYCADEDVSFGRQRARAIDRFETEDRFHVSIPVYEALESFIEWEDVEAISCDWAVSGDGLSEMIELFREATAELVENTSDPEWDYECYTETEPVPLCEFARENGFAIEILD